MHIVKGIILKPIKEEVYTSDEGMAIRASPPHLGPTYY